MTTATGTTIQTERMQELEARGVDASREARPGVPMEAAPEPDPGAHWDEPPRQEQRGEVFRRVALDRLTPVFGTAQPPRWMSGRLRAMAYRIPETRARHWAMLLAADRVDMTEHRLAGMARLDPAEYRGLARNVARRPIRSALMIGLGVLLVRRLVR